MIYEKIKTLLIHERLLEEKDFLDSFGYFKDFLIDCLDYNTWLCALDEGLLEGYEVDFYWFSGSHFTTHFKTLKDRYKDRWVFNITEEGNRCYIITADRKQVIKNKDISLARF